MHISDIPPNYGSREPDDIIDILNGSYDMHGSTVTRIRLHLYVERRDERGPYHLVTALVHADGHSIEMVYDEGYRGHDALRRAGDFLVYNMGISALALRAIIAMRGYTDSDTCP